MEQHILLSSPRYHTNLVELKLIGNSEEVEVSKDTCLKKILLSLTEILNGGLTGLWSEENYNELKGS